MWEQVLYEQPQNEQMPFWWETKSQNSIFYNLIQNNEK